MLERAELPKQIVPVVFDPVFRELLALKPTDDNHGPLRLAGGCGNSLPLLTLRGIPGSPPHAFVAREEDVGRACPLCPGTSDIHLLGDCQGVVDLDPEITHGALNLGVTE
jgi:hypothetical protein